MSDPMVGHESRLRDFGVHDDRHFRLPRASLRPRGPECQFSLVACQKYSVTNRAFILEWLMRPVQGWLSDAHLIGLEPSYPRGSFVMKRTALWTIGLLLGTIQPALAGELLYFPFDQVDVGKLFP